MVSLDEIIAETKGVGKQSKAVEREYMDIILNCGPEFNILVNMSTEDLFKQLPEKVAEGIRRVREKTIEVTPGYDGEYGIIKIFGANEEKKKGQQMSLF